MEEVSLDPTTRASGSGQSRGQPSHLCQACLSVLTRDDLELNKLYPHHKDVKALVEASRMRCYICSWLLVNLPTDAQEGLDLLAEGKMPDDTVVQEARPISRFTSDTRGGTLDYIQNYTRGKLGEGEFWVSFTNLKIVKLFRRSPEVAFCLNPLYDGYIPSTTRVYDTWLSNIWLSVLGDICNRRNVLAIITPQGMLIFALAP